MASELLRAQWEFLWMLGVLLQEAHIRGYKVTMGDVFARKGHMKGSLHYVKLAVDLNLFRGGRYLTSSKAHLPLGIFWEGLGGSWGGRFGDGNHYSLSYRGKK
ncbi:hypothetical protein LCGC14_2142350 [marine sediment metagenome]|uniref:Peptidase M15C domain-containing protein n=1 Tax=marine sediment metagenome TaxID=412755 RepID=A0A0F9EK82_9ZZZZ